MKTNRILALALLLVAAATVQARDQATTYKVTNPNPKDLADAPVAVPAPDWARSVTVYADKEEIPSQLDDISGDGRPDEVAFTLPLRAKKSVTVRVELSDAAPLADRYPARVHAQMFLKEGKDKIVPKTEICATQDNMYNKLHHHGPAFESEFAAYRIYFDKKQTVDLYGKYNPGLELAETLWYPTDEQLAKGAGDDIIRVFGSVGVGTLRGWDSGARRATNIEPMKSRCARIVASGPVRTVVDMQVKGWNYRDREVDITSRYTLWAGHRDCRVENIIENGAGLYFCTGVQKLAARTSHLKPEAGLSAVWGTDWPVNDTVKYAKQTVGLAVAIEPWRVVSSAEDGENYLWLLSVDERGHIDYRITYCAQKENFGVKTDKEFYRYAEDWAAELPVTVKKLK